MDPVTALGLVANVMTFVEYAQVLVSKGYKFYKATGDDHIKYNDLILASERLFKLSTGLAESTKTVLPRHSQGVSVRSQQLYTHSTALIDITRECGQQAIELNDALQRLTEGTGQQVWKSFRKAFKLVWSKQEIDEKSARLRGLREQVVIHLLVVIRYATPRRRLLSPLTVILAAIDKSTILQSKWSKQIAWKVSSSMLSNTLPRLSSVSSKMSSIEVAPSR